MIKSVKDKNEEVAINELESKKWILSLQGFHANIPEKTREQLKVWNYFKSLLRLKLVNVEIILCERKPQIWSINRQTALM